MDRGFFQPEPGRAPAEVPKLGGMASSSRAASLLRVLLLIAPAAFFARPADAQPFLQVGSASEPDTNSQWMLGGGYEIEFFAVPVSAGFLAQTGPGSTGAAGPDGEDPGRQFPMRGYVFAKTGMLPTPGFRAYVGVGAGLATRLGGGADASPTTSGLGLAGIEVGRVHLELQLQRDFGETALTRWVTAMGITF